MSLRSKYLPVTGNTYLKFASTWEANFPVQIFFVPKQLQFEYLILEANKSHSHPLTSHLIKTHYYPHAPSIFKTWFYLVFSNDRLFFSIVKLNVFDTWLIFSADITKARVLINGEKKTLWCWTTQRHVKLKTIKKLFISLNKLYL